jgi:hypothetical protein
MEKGSRERLLARGLEDSDGTISEVGFLSLIMGLLSMSEHELMTRSRLPQIPV